MTSTATLRGPTLDTMWVLLVFGLTLQVAGCVITVNQVPHTELGPDGVVEEGDRTLMLVGLLGFGLGGVMSLIAVIAFGVLLGMRAHAHD